ncbi:MAG: acyl-CoA-binding protein [Panacagrimonas sp.]
MSDLKALFEQAQKDVKTLAKRPTNDELLALYSLFKQATEGDAKGSRPGMLDLVGRAKYDTWAKLKGTTAEHAMQKYLVVVKTLLGR